LFAVFPGDINGWEPVSVAFASQGYVLVAISPAGARGVDIEAHTLDARVALALAREGYLGLDVGARPAVALGGSFSSAILHRLLRDEPDEFAAWVTVGGISNAFTGTADFYAGKLEIPEKYALVIPALGPANLYPVPFLRYSPVYTAAELPPTLIIHTDADHVIPIDQAYELEAALRTAGVPVEVFYYKDVSHYLQVGENMTAEGVEMFYLVIDFATRYAQP
jgi:acetyl esterase/lipase